MTISVSPASEPLTESVRQTPHAGLLVNDEVLELLARPASLPATTGLATPSKAGPEIQHLPTEVLVLLAGQHLGQRCELEEINDLVTVSRPQPPGGNQAGQTEEPNQSVEDGLGEWHADDVAQGGGSCVPQLGTSE